MTMPGDNLWHSLPVPAFQIDPDDNIATINPAAETFLNNSARSVIGVPVLDKLAIEAPLDAALIRVRASDCAVFVKNVDVTGGNAAPVSCDIQIAPLVGMPGGVLMLLAPRLLHDALGQTHSTKSSARSAIGMAEMLAHEIKNPLAGIIGAAQLLAMNLRPQDQEMTDLIVAESRRIVSLLDQVEQFGNQQPPQRRAVNIHGILDQARKSAALGFGENMTFVEDFDPSLPATFADPDQLVQVFLNVFKNASQAAGAGRGVLRIRTYFDHGLRLRRADGSGTQLPLQIEIIDDGPGLPADIAGDIFDPFVSGRENGTGLGLALVSKIINEHDGWISVESTPGRTMFRVSLPIAAQNAAPDARADNPKVT